MKLWGIIVAVLLFAACSSSHKLTGTDYVDIEMETAPSLPADYPFEITEAVEWPEMETDINMKYAEEFRFWIHTTTPPSALYRMVKDSRTTKGEFILYWNKKSERSDADFVHQEMMRYMEGSCSEFHETETYGYCFPEYTEEPTWAQAYQRFELQDIWQIPDMSTIEIQPATGKTWNMLTQVKLGNYYRFYEHQNPELYEDSELRNTILIIANALRRVSWNFNNSISTNLIEGLTNGENLVLCDSSESWQIDGNLESILKSNGISIDTSDSDSYYYISLKGRVTNLWFQDRIKNHSDRQLTPYEVYSIQKVGNKECPSQLTNY